MEYIIFIGLITIFALGLLFFNWLDKLLDQKPKPETLMDTVILYGKSDYTAEAIKYLQSLGIHYHYIKYEYQINTKNNYNSFFALSLNDMENLSMAFFAKKTLRIKNVFAYCTNSENIKFFNEKRIDHIQNMNAFCEKIEKLFAKPSKGV